jgi:hypothetical protein
VVFSGSAVAVAASWLVRELVTDQLGPFTDVVIVPAFWFSFIGWLTLFIGMLRLVMSQRRVAICTAVLTAGIFGLAVRSIFFPPCCYVNQHLIMPTARLSVAGRRTNGYSHLNDWRGDRLMVVTRHRSNGDETYWVWLSRLRTAVGATRCAGWSAPPLPVFLTTDVYQPCFSVEGPPTKGPPRNIASGASFVEFTADDGKRIRLDW